MARVSVILAVILSLFVLSHARLSTEPTTAAATTTTTTSSETSTDADREPSETLDPTVHFVPINEIGDGSLPTDDIFRHIEFSLRRPIYRHRHHLRHFRGHRRHRMRAMEIALGADAIGLPGDRFPLRSSEEKGLVKEEEIKREKPMEEEEEIKKREDDSDSDSDDDEEDKVEKMEKRKRKGNCKKNKKHHHLHRFLRHRHHRHEQDEAEKIGFMKRFWDFLNHF